MGFNIKAVCHSCNSILAIWKCNSSVHYSVWNFMHNILAHTFCQFLVSNKRDSHEKYPKNCTAITNQKKAELINYINLKLHYLYSLLKFKEAFMTQHPTCKDDSEYTFFKTGCLMGFQLFFFFVFFLHFWKTTVGGDNSSELRKQDALLSSQITQSRCLLVSTNRAKENCCWNLNLTPLNSSSSI